MSGDQRVTRAREFLEHARRRKVAELPPSLLIRECAELRRLLGELLDLAADMEDDEAMAAPDVSRVTLDGGVYFSPADVRVLAGALADAAEYREARAGDSYCRDCEASASGLCETHSADLDKRDAYVELGRSVGLEVLS